MAYPNVLPFILDKMTREQRGDTSSDASRHAMLALFIQPPLLAMLFALLDARRFSPVPTKPIGTQPAGTSSSQSGSSSSTSGSSTSSGSVSGSSMSGASVPGQMVTHSAPRRGNEVLEGVGLGKRQHDFFPSFHGYTYRQAADVARVLRLNIDPAEEQEGRVTEQSPLSGTDWPRNVTTVQLRFSEG